MTLRQYLGATHVTMLSWAIDSDPVVSYTAHQLYTEAGFLDWLRAAFQSDEVTVVAHNAAFDVRVAVFLLGLPWPKRIHCTLELAHAAWPDQAGGYSLAALGRSLGLAQQKLAINLHAGGHTPTELAVYCANDVEMCREIHTKAFSRLDPREIATAEMANDIRELYFEVDGQRVAAAFSQFGTVAADEVKAALTHLGADGDEAYGWSDDSHQVKSVKPQTLKKLLRENLGFDTQTISIKKLNPAKLVANPEAERVVRHTSKANKALSHQRRVGVFAGVREVDMELGYHRAHTGRYSSPSVGRGLNLHNLPKRDPAVAKPIRSMYRLPDGYCFVRADAANVEYRMEGWLTGCYHTEKLFTRDILADPYSAFWQAVTGVLVSKKDPARQVAKAAVLGLGFIMGVGTWIGELMKALADPTFKVSLADLQKVCADQGWGMVTNQWVLAQQTKHHAPWEVAAVAYHTREGFHKIHPEFKRLADWLMGVLLRLAGSIPGREQAVIDAAYKLPAAPDRNKLDLRLDPGLERTSVRVAVGGWCETLTWRDMGMHDTPLGFVFSSMKSGNKGFRKLSPNVVIENATQACARNALVKAKHALRKLGWPYLLSVHDELLIVCQRNRNDVLRARRDLISVMGPGNQLGFDWAMVVDPDEINVSESLYEENLGASWWAALAGGQENLLDNLS